MTNIELNEKMARFAQLMIEACKIMEEFNQFAQEYRFTDEELVKDYKFGCHISTLDLPKNVKVRFANACTWSKIKTIGDLVKYGRHKFSLLRNVGEKLMRELDEALERQYNLKW